MLMNHRMVADDNACRLSLTVYYMWKSYTQTMMSNAVTRGIENKHAYLNALNADEVRVVPLSIWDKDVIMPFPFCFVPLERMKQRIQTDARSIEADVSINQLTTTSFISDLTIQSILDAADIAYIHGVVVPIVAIGHIQHMLTHTPDMTPDAMCRNTFDKMMTDFSRHTRVVAFLMSLRRQDTYTKKVGAVINLDNNHFVFVLFDLVTGASDVYDSLNRYGNVVPSHRYIIATYAYVLMYVYRAIRNTDFTTRVTNADISIVQLQHMVTAAPDVPQQEDNTNNCGFYSTLFAMRFKYTVTRLVLENAPDMDSAVNSKSIVSNIYNEVTRDDGKIKPADMRRAFLHNVKIVKQNKTDKT